MTRPLRPAGFDRAHGAIRAAFVPACLCAAPVYLFIILALGVTP